MPYCFLENSISNVSMYSNPCIKLKNIADTYCDLYRLGKISREEAKEHIMPYLDYVNKKSKELANKYNQKHKEITFSYYLRAK